MRSIHHVLLLSLIFTACSAEPGASQSLNDVAVETDDQKTLYALGQVLGQNIEGAGLTEEDLSQVLLGIRDTVLGREPLVDLDEYGPRIQGFMTARMDAVAADELTESMAFVEQQAGLAGAVRTDSGIVIQETTAGTGAAPTTEDVVMVHYHGTLRDGSVFDSSVERGEPATFPLAQVIPCWTEGLQTMQVGGTSRLVCPPDLAYGAQAPPGIPANAALVFEVELLEIVEE